MRKPQRRSPTVAPTPTPTIPPALLAELDLPPGAKFVAYLVQRPDTEEFLAIEQRSGGAELRGFTLDPGRAKRFNTEATAEAAASDAGKGAVMALLFDVGAQYLVAVPEPHPGPQDADRGA